MSAMNKSGVPVDGETIRKCCGQCPTVFEMRPGGKDWAVHCKECLEGSGPCESREAAIKEWNETP